MNRLKHLLLQSGLVLIIFFVPQVVFSFHLGFSGNFIDAGQEFSGKTKVFTFGWWNNLHGLDARFGLSFIESDRLGNTFGANLEISAFFRSPEKITPYLGYGLFAGYSDGVDHVIGAIYPEIGLHFPISDNWSFVINTKAYITTERLDGLFLITGARLKVEWDL